MANRRMLETVMDLYMRQKAQRESQQRAHEMQLAEQENQGRITGANQAAARDAQGEIGLLTRLMSSNDPQLVDRLMKSGRSRLAGQDLAPFAVGGDTFDPQMKQITEAKTPQDLPSGEALYRQNLAGRTNAPIRDLYGLTSMLNARQSQEESLKAGAAPVAQAGVDPTGRKQTTMVNPWEQLNKPSVMEPTGEQAGTLKGNELVTQDKVAGPTLTRRAAATAGAESAARTAAEIKTREANLPALIKVEEEIVKARASGKPSPNTSPIIGKFSEDIVRLATALNQSENMGSARISGARNAAASMGIPFVGESALLLDASGVPVRNVTGRQMTRAEGYAELDRLRKGMTSTMLRALGRQGPATEGDEKRTLGLIPGGDLSKTESQNSVEYFKKLVVAAQQVGDSNPPIESFPPEQQEAEVARRIEEAKLRAGGGGMDPEAEEALRILNGAGR